MPSVAYKAVRGRRVFREAALKVQPSLKDEINRVVKPHFLKQFQDVVANWTNKPTFGTITEIEQDYIRLTIEPIGPNAKYWWWTSRGTKPHLISPGKGKLTGKKRAMLAFREKYAAKTTPKPTWGGPGTSSGPWVHAKLVHHPGTKPRKFEEHIAKENKRWFYQAMEAAWKRTIRRL